ncbi:MAG: hypothetical protein QM754_00030 [Tepidisphaeraceae bacterium]
MPHFKKGYLEEIPFKQTVEVMPAQHLYVTQLDVDAYIIIARHIPSAVDYVLATRRDKSGPRVFTHLGRCVQYAVNQFGVTTMHFELLRALPGDDA